MKVSSPIGDLPFEPKRIRIKDRKVQIDGVMGAWPAKVVIDASDVPSILKLLSRPLFFLLVIIGLGVFTFNTFS
jgi:hypothetical protein